MPPEFIAPKMAREKQDARRNAANTLAWQAPVGHGRYQPIISVLMVSMSNHDPFACQQIVTAPKSARRAAIHPDLQAHLAPDIAAYVTPPRSKASAKTVVSGASASPTHSCLPVSILRGNQTALDVNWFSSRRSAGASGKKNLLQQLRDRSAPFTAETVAELALRLAPDGDRERDVNVLKTMEYNLEHNFGSRQETTLASGLVTLTAGLRVHTVRRCVCLATTPWPLGRSRPLLRTAPGHHSLHRLPRLGRSSTITNPKARPP